jgi:hypothetical protein
MLHTVTGRILVTVACAWLLASEAGALTLGRARGAVLIGRPLDVSIPVTLDAAETEAPCASADVFYGDSKVSSTPAVRWEASGGGQGVFRVTSSALVDEPMVMLHLRVGCAQQASTRRYVLLSEPPPDLEPAARASVVQPPVLAAPAARAIARPAAPAPLARARSKPAAEPRPGPRLKLEPLDLSIDRDPVLRLAFELGAQAASDPQRRQGFAALWQALQKGPEQAMEESLRLQDVERELNSLREATRQNAAALNQIRAHVEQARGDRSLAWLLVIGLVAVLVALLGWIAWRWYRAHRIERVGRWFEVHGESVQGHLPTTPSAEPPPAPAPAPPAPVPAKAAPVPALARAPAAAAASAAGNAVRPAAAPVSTWGNSEEFQASRGASIRMVGVEELIDVHDKADFFLSIGETAQALALLEAHVHDQVETGALAWMDLLDLYHSLGKRAEYERLRTEFRQRFTVQVPDFEHFAQPSASLENYSRALSRIVALWPSRRVLDVIEESIFRKPGLPGAEPFSLEAYRELVLLYHVVKDMAPSQQEARQGSGPASTFAQTSLQPLNVVLDGPEQPLSDRERLMIPPASARLGVDIDLADETASEMQPLDFDISSYDEADAADPARKRG